MKKSKLNWVFSNKLKVFFLLSIFFLVFSLVGGYIFGFKVEVPTALSLNWEDFKFIYPEPLPTFLSLVQVFGMCAYFFGLVSFEKRIKGSLSKKALHLISILAFVMFILATYELLIRFSFWGPYAVKNLNFNLSSPEGHTQIDTLKMGGVSFVLFTKAVTAFMALSLFTFLWAYRLVLEKDK